MIASMSAIYEGIVVLRLQMVQQTGRFTVRLTVNGRRDTSEVGRLTVRRTGKNGLDDLDRKVLRLIRERPRSGLLELARLLGVARGTVQARLDRMIADGVITDFGPNLSPGALGYPVQAFTTLEVEQVSRADISAALSAIPEVLEAHIVTGPGDVWCRVAGRDHEAHPGGHRPDPGHPRRTAEQHGDHPVHRGPAPGPAPGRPRLIPRSATRRFSLSCEVGYGWQALEND